MSGPRPTIREALAAVALPDWGDDEKEEAHRNLLTLGYASSGGFDGEHISLVGEPRNFVPFRVRAEATQALEFTRTYEVAAWFTTIRCEPQTVLSGPAVSGYAGALSLAATFTGTVTDQDMTSLFGGVRMGSLRQPDLGKTYTYDLYWSQQLLMRLFTSGGEHEPRPFEDPRHTGLTLHWVGED